LHKCDKFTRRRVKVVDLCGFFDGIKKLYSQKQRMKLRLEDRRILVISE